MIYTIHKTPPTQISAISYLGGYFAVLKGDNPVANFMFDHPSYQYPIYANDEQGAFRDAELFIALMMEPAV